MAFNRREQILILLTVLCVSALAADHFVLSPLIGLWQTRSTRIAELRQNLDKGQMLVDREDAMEEEWSRMRAAGLSSDNAETEKVLFNALSEWVGRSGLSVASQKPRWLEDEDEQGKKIELRIDSTGNMGSITRFLYELERDRLPFKVEDMEINAQDAKGRSLSFEMRVTGLVLGETNVQN